MRRRRIKSQSEDPHYCKGHGGKKYLNSGLAQIMAPHEMWAPKVHFYLPPPPPNEHDVQDVNTMNIFLIQKNHTILLQHLL